MAHKDREGGNISASDMDMLCSAFRSLVGDVRLDEALARRHARNLVRDLTGIVDVDDEIISRIMQRRLL